MAKSHGGYSVFTGVGERTREGNDLYHEMQETGVINLDGDSKVALIFGQMNEVSVHQGARKLKLLDLHVVVVWYTLLTYRPIATGGQGPCRFDWVSF